LFGRSSSGKLLSLGISYQEDKDLHMLQITPSFESRRRRKHSGIGKGKAQRTLRRPAPVRGVHETGGAGKLSRKNSVLPPWGGGVGGRRKACMRKKVVLSGSQSGRFSTTASGCGNVASGGGGSV